MTAPIIRTDIPLEKRAAANAIVVGVAAAHGVTVPAMLGDCRQKAVVAAREEAIAAIYQNLGLSSPQIGALLNKHHTTILHAMRRTRAAA